MTRLSVEQLETIREGLTKGTVQTQIAKDAGVSLSVVNRNSVRFKKGEFDAYIKSYMPKKGNGKTATKRRANAPSPKLIANIRHLRAQGLSGREVAEKLGVGQSIVFYWSDPKRKIKRVAVTNAEGRDSGKLAARAVALKEKGWTRQEIAEKLGVVKSTVGYYLDVKAKSKTAFVADKEQSTNGTSTSAINKNVCVGIAYAEVERFIGVLGERLGLTPELLRSRLSELLGHSPMRANRGPVD